MAEPVTAQTEVPNASIDALCYQAYAGAQFKDFITESTTDCSKLPPEIWHLFYETETLSLLHVCLKWNLV